MSMLNRSELYPFCPLEGPTTESCFLIVNSYWLGHLFKWLNCVLINSIHIFCFLLECSAVIICCQFFFLFFFKLLPLCRSLKLLSVIALDVPRITSNSRNFKHCQASHWFHSNILQDLKKWGRPRLANVVVGLLVCWMERKRKETSLRLEGCGKLSNFPGCYQKHPVLRRRQRWLQWTGRSGWSRLPGRILAGPWWSWHLSAGT